MLKEQYNFSADKNAWLKANRGISFEEVIAALDDKKLIDIVEHSNQEKYPNQYMFVVDINDYICLVPFVKDQDSFFLKTIFRSRKATKRYRRGTTDEKK